MLSWCFIRLGGLFQVYKVESDHVLKIFLEKRNWESFDLAFWHNIIWKTYFLTCISKVVILFVTLGWWVCYFFFFIFLVLYLKVMRKIIIYVSDQQLCYSYTFMVSLNHIISCHSIFYFLDLRCPQDPLIESFLFGESNPTISSLFSIFSLTLKGRTSIMEYQLIAWVASHLHSVLPTNTLTIEFSPYLIVDEPLSIGVNKEAIWVPIVKS
jgi:hypothetical protein